VLFSKIEHKKRSFISATYFKPNNNWLEVFPTYFMDSLEIAVLYGYSYKNFASIMIKIYL